MVFHSALQVSCTIVIVHACPLDLEPRPLFPLIHSVSFSPRWETPIIEPDPFSMQRHQIMGIDIDANRNKAEGNSNQAVANQNKNSTSIICCSPRVAVLLLVAAIIIAGLGLGLGFGLPSKGNGDAQ